VRGQVDVIVAVMAALEEQLELIESELRRHARADQRCQALVTIFGVGPILACHLLAEIGDVRRFQRPRQLVRASGLDPSVIESAESKRRGRLAKQGSRHLRWALVEAANHSHRTTSPDHALYSSTVKRCGRGRARLTVARKIARRAYHVLAEAA
jgi:transposase